MTTFQPVTPNWLTGAFDQFVVDDPDIIDAYGWDDYRSEMSGEGNWVDMFLDEAGEFPVGRIWFSPDTSDIGLELLPEGNLTWLTKSALELREFSKRGVSIFQAYEYVKRDYFCGEEQHGELTEAKVKIDDTAT